MPARKQKPVQGLVLHFGYVESLRPSMVILVHQGDGFKTPQAAMRDLAHYFLDDYLAELGRGVATYEDFYSYLYDIPTYTASAGGLGHKSFCVSHWNAERWWPWVRLHELHDLLPYLFEVQESAERLLQASLDPAKILDWRLRAEVDELRADKQHLTGVPREIFTRCAPLPRAKSARAKQKVP